MACDCGRTACAPGAGGLGGIGAIGVPPGLQTFGDKFIIVGLIAASACGSDIVVNSSHGTDGSSGGGAAKSADPILRSVQCGQLGSPWVTTANGYQPDGNGGMGLPGKAPAPVAGTS